MPPEAGHAEGQPHEAAPLRVYHVESWFSHAPGADGAGWPPEHEVEVELEVSRRAPGELTVRLALETSAPDVRLRVVYACDYAVDDDVPDAEVEAIVFGAAPRVLYPYLREEVTRLTANSRLGPYPLPFLPPPLQRLERFAMPGSVDDEDGGKDAA